MSELINKLLENSKSNKYPFHMPGHKRNVNYINIFKQLEKPYNIDITEIDGFDDMHHPENILKDLMGRISALYHCKRSFMLVNGSTGGILSAITAVTNIGDEILISRNCHKSIYNSIILRNLKPTYVYPQQNLEMGICGHILPESVEEKLKENRNIKAVVIVSPTYEGIVSDIKSIAYICHSYNIPLIVDEAHGAHFMHGTIFPKSAVECNADIVVQSLHKTLPALTQTGLLHVQGNIVNVEKLEEVLALYQTSSPSYVFMASIEICLDFLQSEKGKAYIKNYEKELLLIRERIGTLRNIRLLEKNDQMFEYDNSKIVFGIENQSGKGNEISNYLREKHFLEMEMSTYNYVVAMTSIMDSEEGFYRLYSALVDINETIKINEVIGTNKKYKTMEESNMKPLKQVYTPYEAKIMNHRKVFIENSEGLISGEMAYIYPPGIPLIVYGEKITKEVINLLMKHKDAGFHIRGLEDKSMNYINTLDISKDRKL